MCGIYGSFSFGNGQVADTYLQAMADSISHRGPDATGHFSDANCAVGNRRLSILDLSEASNQPFYSDDRQIILVQNGEIYNYIELREELKKFGHRFDTSGDTEVLLRAFEHWGPDFVERLNGMFTIAIYCVRDKILRLFRDRLGVKPLYISTGSAGRPLWFASEIKAILAAGVEPKPNAEAIAQYFALNYVPQPSTIFSGIMHLPPGYMAEISDQQGVQLTQYWKLENVKPEPEMSEAEAKIGILSFLDDATRIRMRSDAPFGAFLSGGLDSSSVVGMMSLYQTQNLRTFSIGFDDPRYDETEFAKMAAARFGTEHRVQVMSNSSTEMWPRFIWHCDQPHGDVSFLPMDQVSALASEDVKMVLTGDGADELFAGYEKYLGIFPDGKTEHLQFGWEVEFARNSGLLVGDQAQKLLCGSVLDAFSDTNPYKPLSDKILDAQHQDPINRVLLAETLVLLPGNNLVKPDRMAMANSLEVRSPFLDYRFVEFAFRIPGHLKLADGETKSIYKKAVEPLLGKKLTYRKKQMFTVPIGEWFRQALAGYCREMLQDGRLESRGMIRPEMVEEMITAHIAGLANYTRQLRALISLEIWFRLFIDKDPDWIARKSVNHG